MKIHQIVPEISHWLSSRVSVVPEVILVLGSGLGALAEDIEDKVVIPYADIPHFPPTDVIGHDGRLVVGRLENKNVAVMSGRFHMYEGHPPFMVVLPIRVLRYLGAKWLFVTNAAGGISPSFKPGDLMLINDHINYMGINPLLGPNDPSLGERFTDMTVAYDMKLRNLAKSVAKQNDIDLKEGVYLSCLGPAYETPAEIKMFGMLGADAVGMSTVPEVLAARHSGMDVLGISCISNMAAGMSKNLLNSQEVLDIANSISDKFKKLIRGILKEKK